MGFKLRSSGPFKMMGSSPARQTTTEQDETAGDIEINDPEGTYGPDKGKRLFEMSKKELEALGFGPDKVREIMADGAKEYPTLKRTMTKTLKDVPMGMNKLKSTIKRTPR
jgi:hypothetical protein